MKTKQKNQPASRGIVQNLKGFVVLCSLLWPAVVQAELFTWDDGSAETFGGTASGDVLALNHFGTPGVVVRIDEIRVLWNPISGRVRPTVALYSDPNGDGNPADMVPLLIQPVPNLGNVIILNTSIQSYSIPVTYVGGSFFVGAYLSDTDPSIDPAIGVDLAHLGPNQSWIIENSRAGGLNLMNPIGTSTLRTPLETFVPGNHMIQAHVITVPEPAWSTMLSLGLLCTAGAIRGAVTGRWKPARRISATWRSSQ